MPQLKQIETDTQELRSLKNLVTVFQEVAASQIRQTRAAILQARDFIEGLDEIHTLIQLARQNEIKERRVGVIFIAAQERLQGALVYKSFQEFESYITKHPKSEIIIFGKLGIQLAKQANLAYKHSYEIDDKQFRFEDLRPAIGQIFSYDTLHIFHGQFSSVGRQDTKRTNIFDVKTTNLKEYETASSYVFEPSQAQLQDLFKHELLVSLLTQSFREAHLAKQGSRFTQLDTALQEIDKRVIANKHKSLSLNRSLKSKKQSNQIIHLRAFKKR